MLAVTARPGQESADLGGLLYVFRRSGASLSLLCLTLGEAGGQAAPLGRAVVGGLSTATIATLFVLPSVFAVVQNRSHRRAASLDPDDPQSSHYQLGGGVGSV